MICISYRCRFHLNMPYLNVYACMYTNMARGGGDDVMMVEAMLVRLYINNIYIYAIRIL